jgi:transcriptional regulator with XRE-family HTH domain
VGYNQTQKPGNTEAQKMSAFAEKLKQMREASGLSQEGLAAKAGMNRFGIAKLEQGVREPSWATVQALAKALGVDCTAFANCEDAQARDEPPRKLAGKVANRKAKGK